MKQSTKMYSQKLKDIYSNFAKSRLNYFYTGRNYLDIEFARIVFYSYLFWYYSSNWQYTNFLKFHNVPKLYWQPLSLFKFLPLDQIYIFNNSYLYALMLYSFAMSAAGLLSRIFIPLSFVTSFIFIGFPNNFGTVFDSTCMVTLIMGLLCFSNAGDNISIDSIVNKKKTSSNLPKVWFLNFASFMIMFFYFCSAIQKIRFAGLSFFSPEHMSIAMVYNNAPFGRYLAQFKWLSVLSSVSIVLIQLATIIPLFIKKYIMPFSLIYMIFHLTVDATMGPHFSLMKICFVFIFPWTTFFNDIALLILKKRIIADNILNLSVKNKLQTRIYTIIGLIIFIIASCAVITNKPLWPFSTTTMYSFLDELPYKQKEIYLISKDREYQVTNKDLMPIGKTKVRITINNLLESGHSFKEIALETKKFISTNTSIQYKHLEIRVCTYDTISELRKHYPNSKKCEVKTRLSF